MNTTNHLDNFIKIRTWFVTISNVVGILFFFYMITQAAKYEISWNLFSTFFPGTTNKINYVLQSIGTYILFMPITIIILAFIYPENLKLKVMGSFFGVSSTLIMLTSSFLRKAGTDIYNLKVFLVTKILSLEEKQIIFKDSFKRVLTEKYKISANKISEYQSLLSDEYFITYNEHLNKLKDPLSIYNYASEVIQTNLMVASTSESAFSTMLNLELAKKIFIVGVAVVAVIGIAMIARGFWVDGLKEATILQAEGVKLSAESTENVTGFMQQVQSLTSILTTSIVDAGAIPAQMVNEASTNAFKSLSERAAGAAAYVKGHLKSLSTAVNLHSDILERQGERLTKLEQVFDKIPKNQP
jgi:hypothetical protein